VDTSTEADIIRRVKDGDRELFSALVSAYENQLFSMAYWMTGSRNDSEELVQDTFVRAYEKLWSFDASRRFFPWLYTIGLNLVRRHLRTCARAARRSTQDPAGLAAHSLPEHQPSQEPGPEESSMDAEQRELLRQGVLQLPVHMREALVLRFYQDLTFEEVGEVLAISPDAAKMRVYRALRALRGHME
jgi:RNA polymerase sigma-70 factor (ECF subfamily)